MIPKPMAVACALCLGIAAGLTVKSAQGQTALQEQAPPRPDLTAFVNGVLGRHPALNAAQAQLDAAIARARGQSRPLYNPEVALDYEEGESITKQVGVQQAVDWSRKRAVRTQVARAEVEAARASLSATRNTLASNLLQVLADFEMWSERYQLSQRRVQLSQDFLALAEQRNRAGDLSQSDLLTARLALAEALVNLNADGESFSQAREALVAFVGEARAVWPSLSSLSPLQPLPPLEEVSVEDLPPLRVARAQMAAFRSRIKVAQRDRIPDPTIGVRYGEEGSSELVGVSFSIPVPVWNTRRAEVDVARAEYITSEQNYNLLYRQTEARLAATHERYRAASEAWQEWQANGAAPLEEQRQLLQTLWRAGEIDAVDYLVQLNQTFTTETNAVALYGRLWRAWFQWLDASNRAMQWVETDQ